MLAATAPNIGARSLDWGSTFHPLMKAQRELAEESGKEGAASASFAATDCLRISVTLKLHQKMSAGHDAFGTRRSTSDFAMTALSEGEQGVFDP